MPLVRLCSVIALLCTAAAAGCDGGGASPSAPEPADAPYAAPPSEPAQSEPAPPEAVFAPPPPPMHAAERDVRICVHLMQRLSVDAVINEDPTWFADIERLRARLPAEEREGRFSWESGPLSVVARPSVRKPVAVASWRTRGDRG